MSIVSFRFLFFGALLLTIYYLAPKKAQPGILLGACLLFYLSAGAVYLFFLLPVLGSTYEAGLWMDRNFRKLNGMLHTHPDWEKEKRNTATAACRRKNRAILIACWIFNFSLLFFCKAALIDPLRQVLAGGQLSFLSLGLPLGLSFYMFQSIGYVTDVCRRAVPAERRLLRYSLFVTWFPQMLQGPISRYQELAPHLTAPHDFNAQAVSFGLQRMLWGYFKKLVIADRVAPAIPVLREMEGGTSFFLLGLFYALQIYADFTGGIDLVLGLSQALGIPMTENFRRPYFSKNFAEYWRRWHISLGTWMKNYIFYPLTLAKPLRILGKRSRKKWPEFGKRLPVYLASLLTWCCTGIWHGLTPNFLLWGLLNWGIIVISGELAPLYEKFHSRVQFAGEKWYDGFQMLRTFLLMNLVRSCDLFPDVSLYGRKLLSLVTDPRITVLWDGSLGRLGLSPADFGVLGLGITILFTVSLLQTRHGSLRQVLAGKPALLRWSLIFALFLLVLLTGRYGIGYDGSSFVYNQF